MTITITPTTVIQPQNQLVITVSGSGFQCGSAPVAVIFRAPIYGYPSAVAECNGFVIKITFNSGIFPIHKSISFIVPGVTNPSSAQSALSNVQAALVALAGAGHLIGRDFVGTFPAIQTGHQSVLEPFQNEEAPV